MVDTQRLNYQMEVHVRRKKKVQAKYEIEEYTIPEGDDREGFLLNLYIDKIVQRHFFHDHAAAVKFGRSQKQAVS